MMNYYLITNTATLKRSQWAQQYRYHLVLSQVLAQSYSYRELVREMAQDGQHQIILDNGAHENVVCTLSEYLGICKYIKPWCVVLPDLIGQSAAESRSRSLTFLNWWSRNLPSKIVMYVPQGRCQREIVDEYLWATEYFSLDSGALIGLGDGYKVCYQNPYEDPEAVKVRLLRAMLAETACKILPFHILGGRVKATKVYSQTERVAGIDSVDPCRQASSLQKMFSLTSQQAIDEDALKTEVALFCCNYGVKNVTEQQLFEGKPK